MNDNGPIIALIFFILMSLGFGFMAYDTKDKLEPEDDLSMYEQVAEVGGEISDLEGTILDKRNAIETLRKEIRFQHARYDLNDVQKISYTRAYDQRRHLIKGGGKFASNADGLSAVIIEKKDLTASAIRKEENELRTRVEDDEALFSEKSEASQIRALAIKKEYEQSVPIHRRNMNYDDSVRGEFKRQLEELTTRDVVRAEINDEADGKITLADTLNNTVVINLGTSHGVKNGFRFEVYTVHAGGKRVRKGFIEVRKATPTMSECMIVQKLVNLPTDPYSDYVAKDVEEKYSPIHDSGKQAASAQRLSARPKTVIMGHDPMDPIVVGHLIQNPFFKADNPYTFYVAGDKVIAHGVQQSAIHYTWPQIERVVKYYGSKIVKEVDLGVDFIIAQKNPLDDPEFVKAKTLGIPVVYEWELFRFLDQR